MTKYKTLIQKYQEKKTEHENYVLGKPPTPLQRNAH
jgi:hypothetical protein